MRNRSRINVLIVAVGALSLAAFAWPAHGQDLTLKVGEAAPPDEVAAEFRDTLGKQSIQLMNGDKPVLEFWFRKDIPLTKKPDASTPGLAAIKEVTYLGVARVDERSKDFRNDDIEKGVYTMRLGILPSDGNHLGTSPFPYMAILVPVKYDKTMDDIKDHDTLAEVSGQDTYAEHPNTMSLQPLTDEEASGTFPRVGEGGDNWKFVYVKLPAKVGGGDTVELTFKMVYEGHGKI